MKTKEKSRTRTETKKDNTTRELRQILEKKKIMTTWIIQIQDSYISELTVFP